MKKRVKKMLVGIGIFVLVLAVGIGIFWEKLPFRLVLPYINQEEIQMKGTVDKLQFTGSEAGEQTFYIYLPEGYESSDEDYNTLYHMHGAYLREPWAGYECEYLGSKVESAVADGIIEPMIVVCLVDPEGDSMWSDSFDGQYPVSTAFIQDLIPYVDATYRTVPERENRILQGFSMGGFGAVTNAFRAPELFTAVIVWDGALHDWNTLSSNRKSIASKIFASENYFNQWSPWELTKNAAEVDLDLFMVVGEMKDTREFGYPFREHLENEGMDFIYHDVACPHSIFCIMDDLGDEGFIFMAEAFKE